VVLGIYLVEVIPLFQAVAVLLSDVFDEVRKLQQGVVQPA